MDWISLILQLIALLLADKIDTNKLLELLGQPLERDDMRWHIDPSPAFKGAIGELWLQVEDLHGETGLITTAELQPSKPWRTEVGKLEDALSSAARELPSDPATIVPGGDGSPRPRTFAYEVQRGDRMGVVMVTARAIDREMEVLEILVRRHYD